MKAECLRSLEKIFKTKKDEILPVRQGQKAITILASQEGFKLKTDLGVKEHNSIADVFEALLKAEWLHYQDDNEALWSIHTDLNHIEP